MLIRKVGWTLFEWCRFFALSFQVSADIVDSLVGSNELGSMIASFLREIGVLMNEVLDVFDEPLKMEERI